MVKNLFLWVVIASILVSVFNNFNINYEQNSNLSYSELRDKVQGEQVKQLTLEKDGTIIGKMHDGTSFNSQLPTPLMADGKELNSWVDKYKVDVTAKPLERQSLLMSIFISWFPIILFIGVWVFFMRQMQGGAGKGAMSFGRSRARMLSEDQVKVTFNDVAGCDEAKHEVSELVDFLKDPTKFHNIGGKIPKGVLMVGPPGTGKTLLARAIAGEAKVPFFTISGSDFVEMFVGVGASRVRDMFEQAKKHSPCIIFIDEIDAVGRHRGAGLGGGHDEREQTLNQLLVEMDGFEGNEGVIVIAATNRPDVLDPALLRPGRFDRQVTVGLPDLKGREQILLVHMQKVPVAENVDAKVVARGTPGFSGADLSNLVNEAALFSARYNKNKVYMDDFEKAKDKIMMGVERRSMVMSDKEKRITAYHEAGHAIVGLLVPEHDPVYKVSIIPRSRALGVTVFLPEDDRYSYSKQSLESRLSGLFGGRIAEYLIFGKDNVTTGASNDIQRATDIARNMVTKWGLSDKIGPLTYGDEDGEVFVGNNLGNGKNEVISSNTSNLIDSEVRVIVDKTYSEAEQILKDNMDKLHSMADALLKYETIDKEQIDDIMNNRTPREPKDWNTNSRPGAGNSSSREQRSDEDDKGPEITPVSVRKSLDDDWMN